MNILVYAVGIHRGGGPANHLRGLLQNLSQADTAHSWRFVLRPEFELPCELPPHITVSRLPIRSIPERLYQDTWVQRRAAEKSRANVVLNLIDFGPLPRRLPVLSFQRNPNYYDSDLLRRRHGRDRAEWELRTRLAHSVVRRSDRVLCPSHTMATMVEHAVDVPAGHVKGFYHPFDKVKMRGTWEPASPRRILYTGHLMPHKNHAWLAKVFVESGLADEGVELWMTAARDGWPDGYDELLNLSKKAGPSAVRLLGRVAPEEMAELYRGSTLFVFASAGESFGFPMVEALAAGVPTLAYDTPIAREILGPAARYLPHDLREAARLLRDTMSNAPDALRAMSQSSLARADDVCVSWPDWVVRLEHELVTLHRSWTGSQ